MNTNTTTDKWWRLGMLYLVAVFLLVATFALKTYVPVTAAKKAGAARPGDPGGTPIGIPYRDRAQSPPLSHASRESQKRLIKAYGKLPLSFEANRGQTDPQVKFLSRGPGYTVFLTSTEAVLALNGTERKAGATSPRPRILEKFQVERSLSSSAALGWPLKLGIPPSKESPPPLRHGETYSRTQTELPSSPELRASAVLRMKLVAANPSPRVAGLEKLPGKTNYFLGKDPKKWRTNVSLYAKVKYDSVYPGVDLVYYGNQGQLEYDFVVAPGANPHDIALSIQGAKQVKVDGQGDLVVDISGEVVRFHKPIVYQPENPSSEIKNRKLKIDGHYVLQGENQVGFQVAEYDTSKPLVIDPVLTYSTYLGGSGDDFGSFQTQGIAVDPAGNAYITGFTNSSDFPTTAGTLQTVFGGTGDFLSYFSGDAFVTKLNTRGDAVVYSTYLGGTGDEVGEGIAVDSPGNAYIGGTTFSTDFPTLNPVQAANAGGADSFAAKLSPSGDALVYSTYLGGNNWDLFPMIAIDHSRNLYLQGATFSTNFPVTPGAFQTACASCTSGAPDTYVTKLNRDGTALVYSTYLGGSRGEICGSQIAVDRGGSVYANGFSFSADLPVTPGAFQTACASCSMGVADAFATKLNAAGTGLVYSTYLGGSGFDITLGTAVDRVGNAYVNGFTFSNDFPTINSIQAAYAGGGDAFMAKLNANGTALVYSTYLGGTAFELGRGTAVDPHGNAYAVGITFSTDFPIANPIQATNFGGGDTFLTKLNAAGDAVIYSTYLGGSGEDHPGAIVLDSKGNVYIEGFTRSTNFPTTLNAFQPVFGGGLSDVFVAKISRSHDDEDDDD